MGYKTTITIEVDLQCLLNDYVDENGEQINLTEAEEMIQEALEETCTEFAVVKSFRIESE